MPMAHAMYVDTVEECVEPDTNGKQRGKPEKLNKQGVIVGRVEVHQKGNGNEAKQYQKAIGHSAILAGSLPTCTKSGGALPPGIRSLQKAETEDALPEETEPKRLSG
jgi:hypothetical protein